MSIHKVWLNLSIGKKLFIAIMTTVLMVIAFVAILIFWSMRAGFLDYALRAELDRFDDIVAHLAETHDANNPGWPEIKGKRHEARKLLRRFNPPANRRGPPPLRDREQANNTSRTKDGAKRKEPPRVDPMNLNQRFAIFTADGAYVTGASVKIEDTTTRPIIASDAEGKETIVGYLAMARPGAGREAAVGSSDIFLKDQLKNLVLVVMLAIILSAGAAILLARQFTRPVNELLHGTKKLTQGARDFRLEQISDDEFGKLVAQFNQLAEQLGRQEKAERQWLSDTSHELQTPLAILQAEIEAIQDGVRKPDEKTFATLLQSVARLSTLVKDISQLSHAREGQMIINWGREDISLLAAESASKIEALVHASGLTLEADLQENLIAECDPLRLGQLIDNVLTNALTYTQAPGTIRIETRSVGDNVRILIEDSNSPPPDEAMDKLFDRFYRVDPSRNRKDNGRTGSGLGLSICKLIMAAHHGDIKPQKSSLGGLAMVIEFPRKRIQ